ncbi:DsbA family protein [Haloarchaeobius baliensis]|uniref:DsbA family protein n=1 Tax=Haloarchaeobius baliensis TaxID=1670458 RepID=UPI003F8844BA
MSDSTRRRLLRLGGIGLTASLAGCASVVDSVSEAERTDPTAARTSTAGERRTDTETTGDPEPTTEEPTETQTESVQRADPGVFEESVPLPSNPSSYDYAVMGDPSGAPTATVYGNWKCPFTAEFVVERLPTLVEEYVRTGDVAIEFRSLAYHEGEPFLGADAPRATRFGLGVWEIDPDAFWQFFATVFARQPPERQEWAQTDRLVEFARAAGVDSAENLGESVENGAYSGPLRETVRSVQRLDLSAVPRVVIDSTVTAPTVDFEATRRQFDAAANDS